MNRKDVVFVIAVFSAVYPTLTLGLLLLGEVAPDLSMPVRTLVTTG